MRARVSAKGNNMMSVRGLAAHLLVMSAQSPDRITSRHARWGRDEALRQLEEIRYLTEARLELAVADRLDRVLSGPAPQAFKDSFETTFTSGVTAAV